MLLGIDTISSYKYEGGSMKCNRCLNEDDKFFYLDQDTYYCRKCVLFGRMDADEQLQKKKYKKVLKQATFHLDYELTIHQKRVIKQLNEAINQHQDVLVFAATGAGKTEMVMELIETFVNKQKKVGIAIARRQVVLEIRDRMSKAFKNLDVIAVCEGYTTKIDGDLIVCTMHQLYRYYDCFDLLIMDEIDAFPYAGNTVLKQIAMQSCKGSKVYLTATPDEAMLQEVEEGRIVMLELFVRPHGHPLVVPKIKIGMMGKQCIDLFCLLKKNHRAGIQTIVFVSTIQLTKQLARFYKLWFTCTSFTSKSENKDQIITRFRNKELQVLFSTTILERGITIKGVDVIVMDADHIVFSEASLMQIVGRVGRSMQRPEGSAYYLAKMKSKAMKKSITMIEEMNRAQ